MSEGLADAPRRPWPGGWPVDARDLADLLLAGLWRMRTAAGDGDPAGAEGLAEAVAELAKRGDSALALQAGMVTALLERAYPDEVTGQRVREVLLRCVEAAPPLMDDEGLAEDLALVLGGALGMADGLGDSAGRRMQARILRSGLLVIDDLLARTGLDGGSVLETSMGEIVRSETMEMP